MDGSVSWTRDPGDVTSNASTTIVADVEAEFIRPVTSIVNVWLPLDRSVTVKSAAWICSVAAYVSTSATDLPSRSTSAIPVSGPRAPIQLIDVPVKVNVACAPAVVETAAAPALHGLLPPSTLHPSV